MKLRMNGLERSRRWNNLKQRLGFKGMGCCGAIWSRTRIQTITNIIQPEPEETRLHIQNHQQSAAAGSVMNLAMALAAERNLRDGDNAVGPRKKDAVTVKSLLMLIEETDGDDWKRRKSDVGVEAGKLSGGNDWVCCVCMERNKGAAFIPCGHTFCRVCSRELWLNRGSCPICSRSILEILDIF